jgi:hypothetical protein
MRPVITAACSLALGASLCFPAWAAEPATQASATQANTAPAGKVNHASKEIGGTCLKSTGSRIPPPKGKCLLAPGDVYTQTQLRSTGKTDTASALGQLSPNLTVTRH